MYSYHVTVTLLPRFGNIITKAWATSYFLYGRWHKLRKCDYACSFLFHSAIQ